MSGRQARLGITGCGVLSPVGVGLDALLAGLTNGEPAGAVDADLDWPPSATMRPVPGFDVRRFLGRKGTAFLDRSTGLALVACEQALEDSGLKLHDGNRDRVGIVFGTTVGSLRSMSDYTRETLTEDRPYLVNPALFPNTVMNCAAGQSAIRYGLAGINATIAGGELAFLTVLRYATNVLRRGYAETLLAGVVEELSPHRAWTVQVAARDGSPAVVGECAAVFVVEPAELARAAGRHVDAEVLAVTAGFDPGGTTQGLTGCVRRALEVADVDPGQVWLAASECSGDGIEGVAAELGLGALRSFPWRSRLGECHAAAAGLQMATLLALHRVAAAGAPRLWALAGKETDGTVAAALIRVFGRA